jgi:hypothetical protein
MLRDPALALGDLTDRVHLLRRGDAEARELFEQARETTLVLL